MKDYLSKMLYALTSAYTRKDYDNHERGLPLETNIGKLFSIFAWGLDQVQEQADLIKLWDDLDYAKGRVLDRYGANFGVERGGASDNLYRLFIKVKMIAQLSSGDEDTVVKAAAEFLGVEYSDLESEDVFPAKKYIYVDLNLLSEERLELLEQIAYAIKRTVAAGVGFRLYLRTYHTYVLPVPIGYGAAAAQLIFFQPVAQPRVEATPLPIGYGAIETKSLLASPIGQPRIAVNQAAVRHGAEILGSSCGEMAPHEDRAFPQPLPVVRSGMADVVFNGPPPPTERAVSVHRGGISGAMFRTHIKSRRIE